MLRSGSGGWLHIGMCAVGKIASMKELCIWLFDVVFWMGWAIVIIGTVVGLAVGKWEILYFLIIPICIMLFAVGGLLAEKRKKSKESDKHG